MKRIEFRLSMPNAASWNGKWSGEGRNYTLVKELSFDNPLGIDLRCGLATKSWSYAWSDGWVARVQARAVPDDEKLQKSDGFCGYDWMVESILKRGKILADHEIKEEAIPPVEGRP